MNEPRSAEPRVTALTDALNAVLPDFDIDGDAAAVGSEELAEAVLPVLADNGWHLIEAAAQASAAPPDEGLTRFEVIDHRADGVGRVLVAWPARISLSYQDDGKTLKVFLADERRQ